MLTIPNAAGDTIFMKVKFVNVVDGDGAASASRSIVVHPTTNTTVPEVFFDENGNLIHNDDLELNKWYTMSFQSNGTGSYAFWTFAGVAQGEILIKDITVEKAPEQDANIFTNWAIFDDPVLTKVNNEWMYVINGTKATTATQEHKQINIQPLNDGMYTISFEFMSLNHTGSATANFWNHNGKMKIYDSTGAAVSSWNAGEWYRAVYVSDANLGTGSITIGYAGGSTGGMDLFVRNLQTHSYSLVPNNHSYAAIYDTKIDGEMVTVFSTEKHTVCKSEYDRRIIVNVPNNAAGDTISVKVMFTNVVDVDGNPATNRNLAVHTKGSATAYTGTFTDENGAVVANSALELNKWYTLSWTGDASAAYSIWVLNSTQIHCTLYMKDFTVTPAA